MTKMFYNAILGQGKLTRSVSDLTCLHLLVDNKWGLIGQDHGTCTNILLIYVLEKLYGQVKGTGHYILGRQIKTLF